MTLITVRAVHVSDAPVISPSLIIGHYTEG